MEKVLNAIPPTWKNMPRVGNKLPSPQHHCRVRDRPRENLGDLAYDTQLKGDVKSLHCQVQGYPVIHIYWLLTMGGRHIHAATGHFRPFPMCHILAWFGISIFIQVPTLFFYLELCNHHPIPSQKTYVRDDNPKFLTTPFTWEARSGGLGRSFTTQSILLCLGLFINSIVSSSLTLRRNSRTKFSILLTKGSCWKHCPFCFSVFWNQHTHTNTSFSSKSCVFVFPG